MRKAGAVRVANVGAGYRESTEFFTNNFDEQCTSHTNLSFSFRLQGHLDRETHLE